MTLLGLIVFVLVAALVIYFTKWIVSTAGIPDPPARIILVVVGIILLVIFLQRIGLLEGGGPIIKV